METTFKEIPKKHQISELTIQNTYLVDGELKKWSGEMANVYSTISSTEKYKPTLLGKVPNLSENEAL